MCGQVRYSKKDLKAVFVFGGCPPARMGLNVPAHNARVREHLCVRRSDGRQILAATDKFDIATGTVRRTRCARASRSRSVAAWTALRQHHAVSAVLAVVFSCADGSRTQELWACRGAHIAPRTTRPIFRSFLPPLTNVHNPTRACTHTEKAHGAVALVGECMWCAGARFGVGDRRRGQ
jgi:hypothetical protein